MKPVRENLAVLPFSYLKELNPKVDTKLKESHIFCDYFHCKATEVYTTGIIKRRSSSLMSSFFAITSTFSIQDLLIFYWTGFI